MYEIVGDGLEGLCGYEGWGGDLLGGWVEIGLIIVGRPESIIPGVKHVRVTSSME